ncbi:MAG TPA: DoxX family protein [Ktedonobacteraceae bacterium]|nr:DoxX family protein [Ktedonobacteraceae bacterium]
MSIMKNVQSRSATQVPEPPIARFLFADTRIAWLWLIVRLYVGWQWLVAGIEKLTGYSIDIGSFGQHTGNSWIFTSHPGAALSGFLQGALAQTTGAHPAVQGWYGWFVQHIALPIAPGLSYAVTFGEILVGLGLILGVLTGIAAFFGLFMNMNYLLAGTVSINPIIGALALFIMLAWRVAGYYGIDRWLLPLLGTPWTGTLTRETKTKNAAPPPVPVVR